mmetsp:Transcript_119175/g.282832  ORF Transcript_119175/g.282832 Transcript_119175/m.282832 type:complete len:207 (+) Transcript_119175:145-765(+)
MWCARTALGQGDCRDPAQLLVNRLLQFVHALFMLFLHLGHHALHRLGCQQRRHGIALLDLPPDLQQALNQLSNVESAAAIRVDDLEKVGTIRRQIQLIHQLLHFPVLDDQQEQLLRDGDFVVHVVVGEHPRIAAQVKPGVALLLLIQLLKEPVCRGELLQQLASCPCYTDRLTGVLLCCGGFRLLGGLHSDLHIDCKDHVENAHGY